MSCDLTVVLPTLNEEGALRLVMPRLRATFDKLGVKGEMLVVDGRSTDETVAVAKVGGARVLVQSGRGLGNALREGLLAAESPWVAVVDADGSHPPEILAGMWEAKGKFDLVIASRYVPGGSAVMDPLRQVLSRSLNVVARFVLNLPVKDSSGGFRLYRSELVRAACADSQANDFTVQQELLVGILRRHGKVLEIPFRYEPRLDGASKASALKLAPAYLRMLYKLQGASVTTMTRLETLSAADRFNDEVWNKVQGFVGKEILEVGMGIGIFTEKLLSRGKVFGVDIVPEFVEAARARHGSRPDLEYLVADMGVGTPDSLKGRAFDTIVCMNVLEHIEDDMGTLKRFLAMLKPNGRLVLVVPAHQSLFNPLDSNDGHFRRYAEGELKEKLAEAGFSVVHASQFNFFGIFGWFINGTILRRKDLPTGQMGLFNRVAPLLFWFENLIGPPVGLSVLAVGSKP